MCRFSDAGSDDLTTCSDNRRPKSAKAPRMEAHETAPLFKADSATPSCVTIRAGTRARLCLRGKQFLLNWRPQGVDARIIDAHPRRFADPQDDSWHRVEPSRPSRRAYAEHGRRTVMDDAARSVKALAAASSADLASGASTNSRKWARLRMSDTPHVPGFWTRDFDTRAQRRRSQTVGAATAFATQLGRTSQY